MNPQKLPDHRGGTTTVGRAAPGRVQVAWFFPKANTPNCIVQARQLIGAWAELAADGVDVVGVSFDQPAALADWAARMDVPFPLCSADVTTAGELDAVRPVGDPWRDALPPRVALITDDQGRVLGRWTVHDVHRFADQVRSALNLR